MPAAVFAKLPPDAAAKFQVSFLVGELKIWRVIMALAELSKAEIEERARGCDCGWEELKIQPSATQVHISFSHNIEYAK